MNIGAAEILVVLVIALLVFGPKRLPQMGRQLGRGVREFKNAAATARSELGLDEVISQVNDVKKDVTSAVGIDGLKAEIDGVKSSLGVDELKSGIDGIKSGLSVDLKGGTDKVAAAGAAETAAAEGAEPGPAAEGADAAAATAAGANGPGDGEAAAGAAETAAAEGAEPGQAAPADDGDGSPDETAGDDSPRPAPGVAPVDPPWMSAEAKPYVPPVASDPARPGSGA